MNDHIEKKRLAILQILSSSSEPVSGSYITNTLREMGNNVSDRTARFYLKFMDKEGLTEHIKKRGRIITEKGLIELANARVYEKVGFLSSKIDYLTYIMDFNYEEKKGGLITNISLIKKEEAAKCWELMKRVYEKGFSMGDLVGLFSPGERIGNQTIPPGYLGIGTVCSTTLNGILLREGIPVSSTFGGLLQVEKRIPVRFIEIIYYSGTTMVPLEVFIRSGMTDYTGATSTGNGLIGAGFREFPSACRDKVVRLQSKLSKIGLGGFMIIGWPGQPVLGIPINHESIGAVVIGGLNPAAMLEENGIRIQSKALCGIADYSRFFHFKDFLKNLNKLLN